MIKPTPHIAAMSPYALAKLEVPAGKPLTSLSQNESIRPPSPASIDAAAKAMTDAQLYPDPNWSELRNRLAKLHGIPAEGILCGNGSMELIACLALAYLDRENAALAPAHAYPFFRTATQLARARFDTAPETQACVDIDALLAAVQPDTRILFLANPGNPTGSRISRSEIIRLRDALRDDIILVLDEAYGEFADHLGEPCFDLVVRQNTIVLRTFSKAYGIAGMRVGWGLLPEQIAAEIRKIMNPNNISVAGQAAASAAIADHSYMRDTCDLTAEIRKAFTTRLRIAGFKVVESFTNFVLVRFGNAKTAQSADQALRAEGVIARAQGGAGLPDSLRFTIGTKAQMTLTAEILEAWAKGETA